MSLRSGNLRLAILFCVASAVAKPSPAQAAEPDPRRLLVRGPAVLEITTAFHGAMRKLQDPTCQQVFSDFTDEEGKTLRTNLGSLSPPEYLAQLVIRDGEIPKGSRRCAVPGAAAFTVRGFAVFVCGRNFSSQKPSRRETSLIHEMLHTLGLRENPPTSAEITAQVEKRCGR